MVKDLFTRDRARSCARIVFMKNKIKRLTYNQLIVLLVFLGHVGKAVTLVQIEKETKLSGKSLGGVISSLSRTVFRSIPLIEPVGASLDGSGLRWLLNDRILDVPEIVSEVKRLISYYD